MAEGGSRRPRETAGPVNFAEALRAAITVSGLGLDRIQHRLAERGIPISVATLSYWQSGRRRPQRKVSILAVEQLEEVLGVPDGALLRLVGQDPPRGSAVPHLAEVWDGRQDAKALLSGVDTDAELLLRRLSQHDRVRITARRQLRSLSCRQLMRAERDGADRWLAVLDWEAPVEERPSITGLHNCRLGSVFVHPETRLFAAELLFDQPLRRGQSIVIEYEATYPEGGGPQRGEWENYFRRFRRPVGLYVLEVCFDPFAVPALCQQVCSPVGDGRLRVVGNLPIGKSGTAHVVSIDVEPGNTGVRWFWGGENS